jgi:meromycolic acid enoyl-[acyl-carrier-protein] reductase
MALLDGKKLLITGVLTDRSIAYAVARRAQEEGAEIVLTGFGRALRLTQRMAQRLPGTPDVLELDVTDEAQLAAVVSELDERWGVVDGVLHAIAFVPGDALGGRFLEAPAASAISAFEISAFSLKSLGAAFAPLLERAESGGSLVGLDFDATKAWPIYDWAGVSKAALESVNRYLAQYLGPRGIRSNLVAAGPLRTMAAGAIDGFDVLAQAWEQGAPLAWDLEDPEPVADACLFLLSSLSRAVTGEILHVDGGFHALGVHGAAVAQAQAAATEG